MNNIIIQSKSDQYQFLETIKHNRNKRFKNNLFFAEGVRNINGAVRFGWTIRSFLYDPQSALSDWARGLLAQVPYSMQLSAVRFFNGGALRP